MQSFTSLPDHVLLIEWARYDGSSHLQHLTAYITQLGYVVYTKRQPGGRLPSPHDIRRRLDKALKNHPRYPRGYAPGEADFNAIKVAVLGQYYEEELV